MPKLYTSLEPEGWNALIILIETTIGSGVSFPGNSWMLRRKPSAVWRSSQWTLRRQPNSPPHNQVWDTLWFCISDFSLCPVLQALFWEIRAWKTRICLPWKEAKCHEMPLFPIKTEEAQVPQHALILLQPPPNFMLSSKTQRKKNYYFMI